MSTVKPGRYTARIDGDFVVFVIGMRINKFWKLHKWMPVAAAMPKMLIELAKHPELGLLGARTMVSGRTITVLQYWRSSEHLRAFARNPDDLHLPAWRAFNSKVGTFGDVGIFHETYEVSATSHESIYNNMPVIGLAAATGAEHVALAR